MIDKNNYSDNEDEYEDEDEEYEEGSQSIRRVVVRILPITLT